MNSHIAKALDQTKTGDVFAYFSAFDDIIENNSGIHDNKFLSLDAYDPPCPVNKGQYTKVKLTSSTVDIVNIDKSSLVAKVVIGVEAPELYDALKDEYAHLYNDFEKGAYKYLRKMSMMFVGLKSSKQLFDAYRIYSGNNKTACEQTEALYEGALDRMLKAQEELDEKPQIYTTWHRASQLDEAICGTYITALDFLEGRSDIPEVIEPKPGRVVVTFTAIIPMDDFLPLNGMTLFPNCIFGDLAMELKMTIQNNLVYCQVDPKIASQKVIANIADGVKFPSLLSKLGEIFDNNKLYRWKKAFTQIGDTSSLYMPTVETGFVTGSVNDANIDYNKITYGWIPLPLSAFAGRLLELRSNINGFKIKDSVIEQLRAKFNDQHPYIIPAQFVDYQAFSQLPKYGTTRCNNTYSLTNCSAIGFLFPRTHNEVTCSENPCMTAMQVQIGTTPYPDKPFSTHSAEHNNYNLTNAGFDGLFSASREFAYSLRFKEMAPYSIVPGEIDTASAYPLEDNTSYCFLVATERLSGYGTFCDGITKESAQISLSMTADGVQSTANNPYVEGGMPPIMCIVQDCFWRCTTRGIEFVINDKDFAKDVVDSKMYDQYL